MNAGRFALTGVAVAASCLLSGQAWALGLGRLSVQSALGEQLRAEIDVTSATPEEAASLQLRLASPEAYRAAGIEYNPVLPATRVVVQRRADGRTVLRLISDRAVVEPFLDIILEVSWSSGRLVRAYTLLLDPPTARTAPPAMAGAPTAPMVAASPGPALAQEPPASSDPAGVRAPSSAPPAPAPAPRRAAAPAPVPAAAAAAVPAKAKPPAASGADRIRVQPGDSLSRIASRVRPENVSLEQMLVSLYRANPGAFAGENMNRLRAGSVLELPAADASRQIEPAEARRVIQAQSSDFSAFRQRLAGGVSPASAADAPARQAAGTVQARVEDLKRAAPAPDQLKLSQGGLRASAPEAAVSTQTQQRDAAARVADLARNVEALKKLQGAAASAALAVPAPAAASATPPADALTVAAAPPVAPPPAEAAAASAAPKPRPAPQPLPAPVPETGFIDSLLANPLVAPGAGLLVLGLLGLGFYRLRAGSRKSSGGETSFLESRLQPDSFFGNSGGQRIDTREAPSSTSSSSMSYSLSQLDAIGDVDPVAEADVYLAYGRDLQAEEILKEAMRATPDRQAIRLKLLEVYAKRRDTKGLELLATQVFSMTRGEGPDWAKAQELGRSIDPDNPLYQPDGRPGAAMAPGGDIAQPVASPVLPASGNLASPQPPEAPAPVADLDLDLAVELELPDSMADTSPGEMTQPMLAVAEMDGDPGLDFDLSEPTATGELDFELPAATELDVQADAGRISDFGALDFDFGAEPAEPVPASGPDDPGLSEPPEDAPVSDYGSLSDDPLARKLDLAEEFRQIGDLEGARDLLEEVIAKSDGSLQAKAQGMLDRLA